MPTLSLAIPTYNRLSELATLLASNVFDLSIALGDDLEVIVSDNSDPLIARNVHRLCMDQPYPVTYLGGSGNIGYSGNVLRILRYLGGRATFVMLASDNDSFSVLNVSFLVQLLSLSKSQLYPGGASPSLIWLGHSTHPNFSSEAQCVRPELQPVTPLLFVEAESPFIPFLLLSSFVLNCALLTEEVFERLSRFQVNDYIHIVPAILVCKNLAYMYRYSLPVTVYTPEPVPRYCYNRVFASYAQVLNLAACAWPINRRLYKSKFLSGLFGLYLRQVGLTGRLALRSKCSVLRLLTYSVVRLYFKASVLGVLALCSSLVPFASHLPIMKRFTASGNNSKY